MMIKKNIIKLLLISIFLSFNFNIVHSDNHNFLQIIETLKQDIKTLERAVYSDSFDKKNNDNNGQSLSK